MADQSPKSTTTTTSLSTDGVAKRQARRRQRPLPPDANARNLAIQKERRDSLNETLLDMARLLPALASTNRPSKRLIITEGASHLQQLRSLCISASADVRELLNENQQLVSELNMVYSQLPGGGAMPRRETRTATEALEKLMRVEDEPTGGFTEGFGLNAGPSRSVARSNDDKEMPTVASGSASPEHPPDDNCTQQPFHEPTVSVGHFDTFDQPSLHDMNRTGGILSHGGAHYSAGYPPTASLPAAGGQTDGGAQPRGYNAVDTSPGSYSLDDESLGAVMGSWAAGVDVAQSLDTDTTDLFLWAGTADGGANPG